MSHKEDLELSLLRGEIGRVDLECELLRIKIKIEKSRLANFDTDTDTDTDNTYAVTLEK